jgi:SNF2 family DNA or RNA helicase
LTQQDILLVRQRHEAERAGLHFDYRIVIGDKAYSWATRKELPQPGKSIILHEQPVHDKSYALSKKIIIPKGQYGAGVTTLDFARKGKVTIEDGKYVLDLNDGTRFLIKHTPNYGPKQWLFLNLTGMKKKAEDYGPYHDTINDFLVYDAGISGQEIKAKDDKYVSSSSITVPSDKKTLVKKAAAAASKRKKLEEEPEPTQVQQERVVDKLQSNHPRLIAFHGLGSGKTLTGLKAIKNATKGDKDRAIFITPASLTKNVDKEMKKHKVNIDPKKLKVLSYEKALRMKDELNDQKHSIIVLDEAHKLRNEDTKTVEELREVFNKSPRLLMLSGTPIYNDVRDISSLVNTAAGKRVLPESKSDFEEKFIKEKKINPGILKRLFLGVKPGTRKELKNQAALKSVLDQYVDFYEPNGKAKAFYPRVKEETIKIPMSKDQEQLYNFLEGKIPPHLKWKIRLGLPPDKRELAELNSFSGGLRQVANTHGPFRKIKAQDEAISPKIETAVSNLIKHMQKDKNFRGVVYSNYLSAGVHPYSAALKAAGIPHGMLTGELNAKEKNELVKNYNSGKMPVLLISSAGGEGLDLKGTKLEQILEPHWNGSKIRQVIGRGARYKSHMHLPPEEQEVKVEHYISTVRQGPIDRFFKIKSKSIDEYLKERSDEKEHLKNEVKNLLSKGTN